MSREKILNEIPTRKLSIKITLTNGKTFPDGNNFVIFNCNATVNESVAGYEVFGGGFTAEVNISKTNDLLNNSANITIHGIPEDYQPALDKLQQMTGLALYENYLQIYAGYNENGYDLPILLYQGQLETVQPDKNGGMDSTVIVSKGIFDQKFNAVANPIVVDGAEKLTDLFDRIINQYLNPVDATTTKKVYKLTNINQLCAKNESFNQSTFYEQLLQACLHNNCYPPNFDGNIITITSKDYDKILDTIVEENVLILDENNIIGYPSPGNGSMQRLLTVRYSEKTQFTLLQKIQIVGDYDLVDTEQMWYINSLEYVLQNRGEKWQVTLGLGTFPYNIITTTATDTANSSNPSQTNSSFLMSEQNLTAGLSPSSAQSVKEKQDNTKLAPVSEMQSASTNLGNLLQYWFNNAKKTINTGFPAKIIKADNSKNRYTIESLLKILNYNGTTQKQLVIKNVPAFCPKYTQIEFVEGDIVRVHCDQYYTADIYDNKYTVQVQNSPRRLSASDCVITDYAQDLNDAKNVVKYKDGEMNVRFSDTVDIGIDDNTNVVIKKDKITITRGANKIEMTGSNINIVSGDITLGNDAISSILTELSIGTVNTVVQVDVATGTGTGVGTATFTGKGSKQVKAGM